MTELEKVALTNCRRQHGKRLARLLVNLCALVIIVIMNWIGGCTQIQGIAPRSIHDVRQQIPVKIISEGGQPNKEFIAQIEYIWGRKGPYSSLSIFPKVETNAELWEGANLDDRNTTPVKLRIEPGVDLTLLQYANHRWDKEIRRVIISENEWGLNTAYLDPIELDLHQGIGATDETGDYEPEFILHQPDTINRRANPIGKGTYVVDYDRKTDEWVLSKLTGWRVMLRVPWERERAQALVVIVALVLNWILGSGGAFSLRPVIYSSLILLSLLWLVLPWVWFLLATLAVAVFLDYVGRRLEDEENKGSQT